MSEENENMYTHDLTTEKGKIYDFEKKLVGKNFHSVYTLCKSCLSFGINMPLNKECGDCHSINTITYYDAATIAMYLFKEGLKKDC